MREDSALHRKNAVLTVRPWRLVGVSRVHARRSHRRRSPRLLLGCRALRARLRTDHRSGPRARGFGADSAESQGVRPGPGRRSWCSRRTPRAPRCRSDSSRSQLPTSSASPSQRNSSDEGEAVRSVFGEPGSLVGTSRSTSRGAAWRTAIPFDPPGSFLSSALSGP